ncbi:MAG: hypothetical protein LBJ61_03835 [Deltaproteobacteria bacterium]|jgi:hypothetical protein|nr:hypothetical protein [Deltaproteobacteria bacterium]
MPINMNLNHFLAFVAAGLLAVTATPGPGQAYAAQAAAQIAPISHPTGLALPAQGQAPSDQNPPGQGGPTGTEAGERLYHKADLLCPESPPMFCQTPEGPVSGLVFTLGTNSDQPPRPRLVAIESYRDGLPNGLGVLFGDDGEVFAAVTLKQGVFEGLEIQFYDGGVGPGQRIKGVLNWRNGKLDGLTYDFGEDGSHLTIEEFRDGLRDGTSVEYYPDGSVSSKTFYRLDAQEGQPRRYAPGELKEPIPNFLLTPQITETMAEILRLDGLSQRIPLPE